MSAQRLSKLQKWILIECYKMTVMRERKDGNLARCRHFDMAVCSDNVEPIPTHPNLYNCKTRKIEGYNMVMPCHAFEFTQIDIYARYYKMKPSRKRRSAFDDKLRFEHTPDSDKIYNTVMRSLKNLRKKGYVSLYGNYEWTIIVLNDIGKAYAEKWLASNP